MPYIDESTLDNAEALEQADVHGTLWSLATAGAQIREGARLAEEGGVQRLGRHDRPRSVLVASLGGSSVVADLLDMLAEPSSPVPFAVRRNVPLPGWIGPLDLVVAVSLSGRASGPLALAAEAARRGCSLLTVGADHSPLADVCAQARGVHIGVGEGRQSSRTSLWSLLTPVLVAAESMGLVKVSAADLMKTADVLDEIADECRPRSESFVNPAKSLALQLCETVPVVLGDGPLSGVSASRTASMLARTARVPATHGELPDAASQVVATFDGPFTAGGGEGIVSARPTDDIFADPFLDGPAQTSLGLLMIRDHDDAWQDASAAESMMLAQAVMDTARDAGVRVATVGARPGHPLTRVASQIALTDFMSTYMSLGFGLDPSISRHITQLRDVTQPKV